MSVYVDPIFDWGKTGRWPHMVADTLDELHVFASTIGMRREWFQDHPDHPHYDLRPTKWALAKRHGAIETTAIEVLRVSRRSRAAADLKAGAR
jgi:hypothetical protein